MDVSTMIELVRNRCLIRSVIDDSDLYPYPWTYTESLWTLLAAGQLRL